MRIVFSPETYNLGETTRGLEVASAAARRGHEVRFHAYAQRYAGLISEAGHALTLAEPRMTQAEADQIMAVDQGRGWRHPFTTALVRARVSAELTALRGADAVVIGTNPTMFLSARIAGVPLFYVRPYYFSRSHLMDLDDGHRAPAPWRTLVQAIRWRPRAFTTVAREHAFTLPERTVEAAAGDVDLIASLFPRLDGRVLDPRDRAVGPVHWKPELPLPEVVHADRQGRPLIYVGMGSSGSPAVLRLVLEALSGMQVDVLVSGAVQLSEVDVARLGPRIHRAGMVPEHRLRGHISAAIVHGGEGTVQAACAAGVPFTAWPMQGEQRWNVGECVRAGVALRLRRRDLRAGRLASIVRRLLTDEPMRLRAEALADRMAGLDGPAEAVRAIESAVGSLKHRPRPL